MLFCTSTCGSYSILKAVVIIWAKHTHTHAQLLLMLPLSSSVCLSPCVSLSFSLFSVAFIGLTLQFCIVPLPEPSHGLSSSG